MRLAYVGSVSCSGMFSSVLKNVVVILSKPSVRWPFQLYHSSFLNSLVWLCKTSESNRCGCFCAVHWVKSLSRVCRSEIQVLIENAAISTCFSCSSKNSFANVDDPTGEPSKRNPVVSSTGESGAFDEGLVEYVAMVCCISMASCGLVFVMSGIVELPVHEVSIRVL